MPFKKGISGNPNGRPKGVKKDNKSILVKTSWNFLLKQMRDKTTPATTKRKIALLVAGRTAPQDKTQGSGDRVIIIRRPIEENPIQDNSNEVNRQKGLI